MFNYDLTFEGQWFASFCLPERGSKEILLVKPVQGSEYMHCKVEVRDWNFGRSPLLGFASAREVSVTTTGWHSYNFFKDANDKRWYYSLTQSLRNLMPEGPLVDWLETLGG